MNNQQQPKQLAPNMNAEALAAATQVCHQQLHETRQKIIGLFDLFQRTSAAYYTMCDLNGEDTPMGGPELLMALSEFQRRGLLQFADSSIEQLSKDYVQTLKMLKQAVDNGVTICDRLATLSGAQRSAQQKAVPPAQPPPSTPQQKPYQNLDEALEAELNAEGG